MTILLKKEWSKVQHPLWIAFCREAAIAGQSISSGLESLRKANYAATGHYSHAFFSLSIGLERMGKLIFIVDQMIKNNGATPTDQDLRTRFGHKIEKIFEYVETVHCALPDQDERYPLAADGIERQIVKFLSDFGETTRYYNLDLISGAANKKHSYDPVAAWDLKIGTLIYNKHYSSNRQKRDLAVARQMHEYLSPLMHVMHTSEQGDPLTSVEAASLQTGKNRILQKYGTFYTAKICRFFFMVIYQLHRDSMKTGLQIPFLDEFFFPFMNDDSYLINRKTFPPRS
jgi:hypothetical protein